ncbi:rabenosyn-5 [Diorhabda carinulata]|uniref:rabenosyn-5 n=1 Tax=Diorhabda carinulata TaxID=1163345 RepID=UPI0025A1302D|nr:rabenosyn-5 [Diorhabda carinulata]
MAEATIQEGFLCPICHKDLRSANNLITHFQDLHSEDKDLLTSIKEIYGKVKKKILTVDDQDIENFRKEISLQEKYYLEYSEPQDPGPTVSHTDYFKSIRRDRLDHKTAETNKLIIRLDRLLRVYAPDRKQHEQELVAWLDGSTVSRCPSCASSFNITRRQHHCRLCGSIMCNSCSYFLSYETAQTIITPLNSGGPKEPNPNKETDSLRICYHCLDMLDSRRRVQIDQVLQPIICQLYSHLQNMKSQVESSTDMYMKVYNSIISGETTYILQDLQSLRTTIADKAQMIDTISKKIASLSVDPSTPKAMLLQNNIRKATSMYIKDYLLTLPAPPTLQEIEKIRYERSSKAVEDDDIPVKNTNIKKVTVTTGWSPANVKNDVTVTEEEDPLLEQISIVTSYIKQARENQRFEEVASLQENLNMLKEMYRKQHYKNL